MAEMTAKVTTTWSIHLADLTCRRAVVAGGRFNPSSRLNPIACGEFNPSSGLNPITAAHTLKFMKSEIIVKTDPLSYVL